MRSLLVIDDDCNVHRTVEKALEHHGFEVFCSLDAESARRAFRNSLPDVILLNIKQPHSSGLDLFRELHSEDQRIPVIFMTSDDDNESAIRAMQSGAFDYLNKPLDLNRLPSIVATAAEVRRMMLTPLAITVNKTDSAPDDRLIGRSESMMEVLKSIGRVASQAIPVLILGESGTGKELVARAIHHNSLRSEELFYAVNCAALPDSLLESELFGHEKGAFTGADRQRIGKFEACRGGTIFLDEVGDMSPMVQAKILRVLQQQEFQRVGGNSTLSSDVRIIAATNLDLVQMVADGEFREDLYYRLNGVTLNLPPLRQRKGDLPLLISHFLTSSCRKLERPDIEGISSEALEALLSYDWPGNVRQLLSVIRHSILNASGPVIVPAFLPAEISAPSPNVMSSGIPETDKSVGCDNGDFCGFIVSRIQGGTKSLYAETLEQMERYLLRYVLSVTGGNQSHAAEVLGITRGKVRNRVRQFGLQSTRRRT